MLYVFSSHFIMIIIIIDSCAVSIQTAKHSGTEENKYSYRNEKVMCNKKKRKQKDFNNGKKKQTHILHFICFTNDRALTTIVYIY